MQRHENFKVRWDDKDIPGVLRVTAEPSCPNCVAIERTLVEDTSLKDWMDYVLAQAMSGDGLTDLSIISKDVHLQEPSDSGEETTRSLLRCKPVEYSAHPARNNQPSTPDSVERLVLQYDDQILSQAAEGT